jgi:hypothetical protein
MSLLNQWPLFPSLVKIILFLGLWLVLWLPVAVSLANQVGWHFGQDATPPQKLALVIPLYLLSPLAIAAWLELEPTSLDQYGLVGVWPMLRSNFWGWGLGLGGLALTFTLESWGGYCHWHYRKLGSGLSVILPIALLAGSISLIEEFIFRGLLFSQLQQDFSPLGAALLTSCLFAGLHLIWEQTQTWPQLPGLAILSLVLVLARLVDGGNLGLAWGLHSAWIFGLTFLDTTGSITYPSLAGNSLVGKYNQPLAGIGGLCCLGLTALVLWAQSVSGL